MSTAPESPRREHHGAAAARRGLLGDVWAYRFALHNLILKDFRIRYRNMSLGIVWSVLNPLVMLGVLVVVFSYIHPTRQQVNFPIFLLLGLIAFNFFSLCLNGATACVIDNASLVKKVIFPRVLIPLAVVLSQTLHLLIQLGLLGFFLLVFAVPPALTWLWLPVIYLVELVFILGAALLVSAANVFYRDVLYLVQSGVAILFWFTPIFYSVDTVRANLPRPLYLLYLLNPLAGCIHASRKAVLWHAGPEPLSFGLAVGVALATLVAGVWFFRRRQAHFADRL